MSFIIIIVELKGLRMKNLKKRIIAELDIKVHSHIKQIVAIKNISMNDWFKEAIAEQLKKEKELGF